MKTLIIGASGLVGGYLHKEFIPLGEVKGTAYPEPRRDYIVLDMRDKAALSKLFSEYRPNLVLCPAAISDVEYCEQHPAETRWVNVEGVNNVIQEAKNNGAKFIFFSSEYVFDGGNGPYSEDDTPNPLNEYGRQKLEVENIIKKELCDYIIIRTTVVYGWEIEGKNFVMRSINNLGNGISMNVPFDQFSSPTYAEDLAFAVKALVKKNETGIFNAVGSRVMSRYEFAKLVCSVFELDQNLLSPVATVDLGQKAKRPLRAGLKIDKIKKISGAVLSTPQEGLNMMKERKNVFFAFG